MGRLGGLSRIGHKRDQSIECDFAKSTSRSLGKAGGREDDRAPAYEQVGKAFICVFDLHFELCFLILSNPSFPFFD